MTNSQWIKNLSDAEMATELAKKFNKTLDIVNDLPMLLKAEWRFSYEKILEWLQAEHEVKE